MTRFNFLRHELHFDKNSSNWKKQNEKRRYSVYNFPEHVQNTCNITKYFVAQLN